MQTKTNNPAALNFCWLTYVKRLHSCPNLLSKLVFLLLLRSPECLSIQCFFFFVYKYVRLSCLIKCVSHTHLFLYTFSNCYYSFFTSWMCINFVTIHHQHAFVCVILSLWVREVNMWWFRYISVTCFATSAIISW